MAGNHFSVWWASILSFLFVVCSGLCFHGGLCLVLAVFLSFFGACIFPEKAYFPEKPFFSKFL